jgi:hypothetical protein
MDDDARLSKLLWDAREYLDMFGDIAMARYPNGGPTISIHKVRDEIDAYRSERGWSPNGFGGE